METDPQSQYALDLASKYLPGTPVEFLEAPHVPYASPRIHTATFVAEYRMEVGSTVPELLLQWL